jgi:hypothetical protein
VQKQDKPKQERTETKQAKQVTHEVGNSVEAIKLWYKLSDQRPIPVVSTDNQMGMVYTSNATSPLSQSYLASSVVGR